MSDKRHFTIVEGKKEHGLFVSSTPSGAARKVVSKLSKGKKVTFYLREITQGSKKKVYGPYEGMKKKLSKPVKVGDIVYKYIPMVKKLDMRGGGDENIVIESGSRKASITKKDKGFFSGSEYDIMIEDEQGPIFQTNEKMDRSANKTAETLREQFPEICEKKDNLTNNKFLDSWRNLKGKIEEKCKN